MWKRYVNYNFSVNVIILSFHPLDHIWILVSILQPQHILEPHSAPMISTLRSQLKITQCWGGLWQMESGVPRWCQDPEGRKHFRTWLLEGRANKGLDIQAEAKIG